MSRLIEFVALASLVSTAWALDCVQIPDSYIFAGDEFFHPHNNSQAVTLPPNFNCIYLIKSQSNSSDLLYGTVEVTNMLKGVNDYITVTDSLGAKSTIKSQSDSLFTYEIFPGRNVSVRVVTKSVQMNSQFLIRVTYEKVNVGPTTMMKTGGAMNFVDLSTLRGYSDKYSSSITIKGTEPIALSMATSRIQFPFTYLFHCYVIDGDFNNQQSVHRLMEFVDAPPFWSKTNTVTIVSFRKDFYNGTAAVLNPISEAQKFGFLFTEASLNGDLNRVSLSSLDKPEAVEILAVQNKQIIMTSLTFTGKITSNCTASVVTGPPNNSSQLLLDLKTAQGLMPYTFNLQYFSVIAKECSFAFTVKSPEH